MKIETIIIISYRGIEIFDMTRSLQSSILLLIFCKYNDDNATSITVMYLLLQLQSMS